MNQEMALAVHAPAIPHAPELRRADRLGLFETMARSRHLRRRVAEQRRARRMPAACGTATAGWEALEAAALRALREGDLLVAPMHWPAPRAEGRRVGASWALTDSLAAGLGAAIASRPGEVVLVLTGAAWAAPEAAIMAHAVERAAPLVVLQATSAEATPAGSGGFVCELVSRSQVEQLVLAVDTASNAARAGQGPTLLACRASDEDPIDLYVKRMGELGLTSDELREVVRSARSG